MKVDIRNARFTLAGLDVTPFLLDYELMMQPPSTSPGDIFALQQALAAQEVSFDLEMEGGFTPWFWRMVASFWRDEVNKGRKALRAARQQRGPAARLLRQRLRVETRVARRWVRFCEREGRRP